jgi:hypothetical protein
MDGAVLRWRQMSDVILRNLSMQTGERRARIGDRRRRATPAISRYLFTGRRRVARREDDRRLGYYTDVPPAKAVTLAVSVLVLSVLDAVLSLRLFAVEKAVELNPLLRLAFKSGDGGFIFVKLTLTLVGVLVILRHWNFSILRRMRIASVSGALVGLYAGLVVYEIILALK